MYNKSWTHPEICPSILWVSKMHCVRYIYVCNIYTCQWIPGVNYRINVCFFLFLKLLPSTLEIFIMWSYIRCYQRKFIIFDYHISANAFREPESISVLRRFNNV